MSQPQNCMIRSKSDRNTLLAYVIKSSSPQTRRSSEARRQVGEPRNPVRERDMVSPRAVPAVPSTPYARGDTQHQWRLLSRAPFGLRGALPGGMGHITGCRGRVFWDCTRFIMGGLAEEPKTGKERDRGSLGRKQCGKIELGLVVSKQAGGQ